MECYSDSGLRGERGSSTAVADFGGKFRLPLGPTSTVGLRGLKVGRPEGDPHNLIRTMPAKGARLVGPSHGAQQDEDGSPPEPSSSSFQPPCPPKAVTAPVRGRAQRRARPSRLGQALLTRPRSSRTTGTPRSPRSSPGQPAARSRRQSPAVAVIRCCTAHDQPLEVRPCRHGHHRCQRSRHTRGWMVRRVHYDQRVLALVEVAGGERDWREAERIFETHGWPVIDHAPRGSGPTAGALAPDPSARVYQVEVRLHGAAYRAETGAAWRIQQAARAARLRMCVRRSDLINPDPSPVFDWRVVPAEAVRSPRSMLKQARMRFGSYDTGAHVSGHPREAWRLAQLSAPDGTSPSDVSVRPVRGGAWSSTSIWGEKSPRGRTFIVGMGFMLGTLPVAVAGRHDLVPVLYAIGSAFGSFAAVDARSSDVNKSIPALLLAGTLGMLFVSLFADLGRFSPIQQISLPLLPFIIYGIWLIARQWTWGEWVAWTAPLAVTLLLSSFVGAAPVLHAWYAEKLSISAGDLEVPALWQAASAIKLLSTLTFLLIMPAAWGFARHFHLVRAGDRSNSMLYLSLLSALLMGVGVLAAQSAEEAARKTALAAKEGMEAPPYFGVKPEWTCVFPVVPPEKIPSEGGRLDMRRAHLSLGSSAGHVLLLESGSANPIKVPTQNVALVPADSAHTACR